MTKMGCSRVLRGPRGIRLLASSMPTSLRWQTHMTGKGLRDNDGAGTVLGGRLDYRILGPLEVFCDERPVKIGTAKERAVLALLLLHANKVVSVD